MLMDIPAPGLDIGLQIGDAVDDGHGHSRFRVERFGMSSTGNRPPNIRVIAGLVPAIHV
jgi:hypothetical protein